MIDYECYEEGNSCLRFKYLFACEPWAGDTVDASEGYGDGPDIWEVVRRHWVEEEQPLLIVRRPIEDLDTGKIVQLCKFGLGALVTRHDAMAREAFVDILGMCQEKDE